MDISIIAGQAVELLKPHMAELLTAGAGALGKEAFAGIWGKLGPKIESDQNLKKAAQDVAAKPTDPESAAVLKEALRQLLERDTTLARDLQPMVGNVTSGRDTFIGNYNENSSSAQIGSR